MILYNNNNNHHNNNNQNHFENKTLSKVHKHLVQDMLQHDYYHNNNNNVELKTLFFDVAISVVITPPFADISNNNCLIIT